MFYLKLILLFLIKLKKKINETSQFVQVIFCKERILCQLLKKDYLSRNTDIFLSSLLVYYQFDFYLMDSFLFICLGLVNSDSLVN